MAFLAVSLRPQKRTWTSIAEITLVSPFSLLSIQTLGLRFLRTPRDRPQTQTSPLSLSVVSTLYRCSRNFSLLIFPIPLQLFFVVVWIMSGS